ncbi:carbohydrate binding domain-containing protein [Georgenia halophila]|uniref:carbohydrate binding domain-containing protein n=1 Tax=Georgenia halophila TaxID=620889 RepID=UPI0031EB9513
MPTRRGLIAALATLALLVPLLPTTSATGATGAGAGDVVGPVNGGFEEPADGQIPGWTQRGGTLGGSSVVDEPVYAGTQAVRLEDPEDVRSYGLMSDTMPVQAGHSYQASMQVRVERGAPTVYVYFYDEAGTQLDIEFAHFTEQPHDQWSEIVLEATAPEGAATAAIYLYSNIARISTYYVDDVTLTHTHGPLETTDLGAAFYSPNVRMAEVDVRADGTPVAYVFSDGQPVSFNAVDLRTGELLDSHDMTGYSIGASIAVDEDDRVYFSVRGPNDGTLWRYDPAAEEVERLAGRVVGERMLRTLVIDDGVLYGSTYPNAKVFSYDIATGNVRDYGSVVEDGSSYAWGFEMVEDSLWVGTGTTPHLIELDPVTGETIERALPADVQQDADFITGVEQHEDLVFVTYSPAAGGNTVIYDLTAEQWLGNLSMTQRTSARLDGNLFYLADGSVEAYDVAARQSVDVGFGSSPLVGELDNTYDLGLVELGTEDFPGAAVVGARNDGMLWRYDPATGHGDVIDPEITGAPATVHSVGTGGDGDVYFGAYLSAGVMARVDMSTGTLEQLDGPKQADAVVAHRNRTVVGTYPGAEFYVGQANKDWQWGTNPRHLFSLGRGDLGQDRPLTMVSAGPRIAAGTIPNYGELGGALTLFHPDSGHYEVHRNVVADQSVTTLAYRDGLVYGGTGIHGGLSSDPTQDEAELFVWDTRRDELVTSEVVVPGAEVIHALAFDDRGRLWGFADNGVFFQYDTDTGEVATTVATPARAGNDWGRLSELYLHPDGRLYGNADGRLFRFDPDTQQFVTLAADGARHSMVGSDGAIYLADETNIYRFTP